MTNEQLVIKIKSGEKPAEHMEQLYSQVRRFIHSIAWRFRGSGELEDLEQEGFLALYSAIEGYDPEQGVKFLTYAEYHIRQRIQRYLQMNKSSMRVPAHCQERQREYNRLCQTFAQEYGCRPTDEEAACYMGLTVEQIKNIKKTISMGSVGSLDTPVSGLDGTEDTTVGDMVAAEIDVEQLILEQLDNEKMQAILWASVDALNERQRMVIRKRYMEGLTLKEVGRELNLTPEAVRQIHNKALRELRKPSFSNKLRPFLEEEHVYITAFTGNGVQGFNRTWSSSTERTALQIMEQEWQRRKHIRQLSQQKPVQKVV